ncbi:MAG: TonB-dependent receptor [Pyrinomonadaceae bacterium]|nr:TonB-dependent receptor [Pyrinomonadaceae bacterium]
MIRKAISFAAVFIAAFVFSAAATTAQTRIGTVQGTVKDPNGAVIPNATVTINQSVTGYNQTVQADAQGTFKLVNVPFNTYTIRAEAAGFEAGQQAIDIESNLPVNVDLKLSIAGTAATVNVTDTGAAVEADKTSSDTDISENLLLRKAGASPSSGLAKIVASAPGIATDDNDRMHPRGSESQVQYVVDGVPITDNLSSIFATSLDARMLRTVEVLTGGIPAEFGDKLAAVVNVNTRSGLEVPTQGGISLSSGSFRTREASVDFSTRTKKFGFLTNLSATTSRRFLDPPVIENFHNLGNTAKGFFRMDYQFNQKDSIKGTFMFGGTNFQVPNRLEQQLAGQDQNQRLRDNSQFITFQHIFSGDTLGQFSFFNRSGTARLNSNPESTPVVAFQDRKLQNTGGIASLSLSRGRHTIKFGGQFTITRIREDFSFYPTEVFDDLTDENGNAVANPINQFTAADPFIFSGRKTGRTLSAYVQDRFSPARNLTLDLGLRYDNYRVVISDFNFSPRIGLAYFIPRTQTTLRASYNRLFQTPPAENLLLASSVEAAAISPIAVLQGVTVVRPILPDKENVFELGAQQQLSRYLRMNLTLYQKRITNFADKDQFIETGIIFPISIASGRVTGEEIRIESAEIRGFRGFVSYANTRAYGVTPINGGLFLGEDVGDFFVSGLKFANDHDERNFGQFQISYNNKPTGIYAIFAGRYDSGYPTEVEPGTTLADFVAAGFDPRLYDQIDFQRGRVRPRTILDFSIGADLFRKERSTVNVQFDIQNLTNRLFLYNFESVFSGTHIGYPRMFSGRVAVRFK